MSGFVYAIESGDIVKIGWSHKPLDRLHQIRTTAPNCRLLGVRQARSQSYERAYHLIFSEWQEKGEWFRKEGEVKDFLKHLQPYNPGTDERSALRKAVDLAGNVSGLAKLLGSITPQAVSQWRRVPAERVIQVEKATGIPRHELRPDIYPSEPSQAAE